MRNCLHKNVRKKISLTRSIWAGEDREKEALTYGLGSELSILNAPPGTSNT